VSILIVCLLFLSSQFILVPLLQHIRHRNLVKILTACSSVDFEGKDFKALVYEFMPNGNLEMWLHPEDGLKQLRSLSLLQRMDIAIDVASALLYLHHHCQTPIIHCDLKPSNVLLDDDLTAHISDFGLARLLSESGKQALLNQLSSAGINGTVGYAPPGNVSTFYSIILASINNEEEKNRKIGC
jgi:LRR receptor-like serine/threonine-protein kinase EFR